MQKALLSIAVAFFGYSLHNIAQASQKIGLGLMERRRLAGVTVWITATVFTSVSSLIILYAVSLGYVALVGAMAGSGLATLALFSMLVMKEKIRKVELVGVSIILGSVALIGVFSDDPPATDVRLTVLYVFFGAVCFLSLVTFLALRKKRKILGIVIGSAAGAVGGFIPMFQKISTINLGRESSLVRYLLGAHPNLPKHDLLLKAAEILSNPFAVIWIVISVASMLVLQVSYKMDRAIRVIPAFSAGAVVTPVIGGIVAFRETVYPLQWIGLILILAGIFLITLKIRMKNSFTEFLQTHLIRQKGEQ
jgi:multidrug transporter EmrE-like cation transporter